MTQYAQGYQIGKIDARLGRKKAFLYPKMSIDYKEGYCRGWGCETLIMYFGR